MNLIQRALALREGGQTTRCHTMQYVGPYNVAMHSYNALSLLLLLHHEAPPSIHLIKAVMFHDTPERWTGDIPTPAKMASKGLKIWADELEMEILKALGYEKLYSDLTTKERQWLAAVDLLELFMWGAEQAAMGNSAAMPMNNQIRKIFKKREKETPKEVLEFIKQFKWQRMPECHELIGEDDERK